MSTWSTQHWDIPHQILRATYPCSPGYCPHEASHRLMGVPIALVVHHHLWAAVGQHPQELVERVLAEGLQGLQQSAADWDT